MISSVGTGEFAVEQPQDSQVPKLELILGPADSGKSAWAEERLLRAAKAERLLYIATLPYTPQFQNRIDVHRSRRSRAWDLVEVREDLNEVWLPYGSAGLPEFVLLDGLVAYVNLRLLAAAPDREAIGRESERLYREYGEFVVRLASRTRHLVVVTTIPPANVERLPTATVVDRECMRLNRRLCDATLAIGAHVWTSALGQLNEVDECAASFE